MRQAVLREPAILAGYVILAMTQTGLWSDFSTRYFAGADATQDVGIVNWVSSHVFSNPRLTFEGNNFYPSHDSILFTDPLLGPSLLVVPLRRVTDNPVLLYNFAVVCTLSLSSWGFYRLATAISGDRAASLLAGIIIPYSAQQTHHLTHLNLLSLSGFPFFLLAVLRLIDQPGLGSAAATALAFAFQAGTSGYHAFSGAFLAVIVGVSSWRQCLRLKTIACIFAAVGMALLMLWPYLSAFTELSRTQPMTRDQSEAVHYSLDLARALGRSESYLWRGLLKENVHAAFPGLVTLVFGFIGWVRSPSARRRLLQTIAIVFLLLALGPVLRFRDHAVLSLPTSVLYDHLPLFGAVRHPVIFIGPAMFGLGLLAVLGVQVCRLSSRAYRMAIVLFAATLECLVPSPRRAERPLPVPAVYRYLAAHPPGAILELPVDTEDETFCWWSIRHGLPIVNGTGSFEPSEYSELVQRIKRDWRDLSHTGLDGTRATDYLKAHFPIRYVILHATAPYLRESLDRSRETFDLLDETAEGDRVYEIHRRGHGDVIRRAFRDDQLSSGGVWLRLSGPDKALVEVMLNDEPVARFALSGVPQELILRLEGRKVRRGLNFITIRRRAGNGEITLKDISSGWTGTLRPSHE